MPHANHMDGTVDIGGAPREDVEHRKRFVSVKTYGSNSPKIRRPIQLLYKLLPTNRRVHDFEEAIMVEPVDSDIHTVKWQFVTANWIG